MEIFEATIAIEQAGGNENLARELFTMFINELPEHSQSIQQALGKFHESGRDCQLLWDPVHKLHGATAYLGVPALRVQVRLLEDCIRQNQHTDIEQQVQNLLNQIQTLMDRGRDILAHNWQ